MSSTRNIESELARNANDRTHLENHMFYFSDHTSDANLSFSSMKSGIENLGFSNWHTYTAAAQISGASGYAVKGCPFRHFTAREGVSKLIHADDTRIYGKDGNINEDSWKKLLSYAQGEGDALSITKERFNDFLQYQRDTDLERPSSMISKSASKGEWDDFWDVVERRTGQDCIKITDLRVFFEDSTKFFDEILQPTVKAQL